TKQVKMLNGVEYLKIDDAGLHIRRGDEVSVLPVDTIILCAGQEPLRELQAGLEAAGKPVHLIGGADVAAELDAKRAIDQGARLPAQSWASTDVRGGGRGRADPCIRPPAAAPPALLASTDPPLPRGLPLQDISRRSCQVCHNRKSPFRVNSVRGGAIAREKRQSAGYKKRMGTAIMTSRDPGRVNKPLLTEAVMFFSDQGIAREMLFTEFEALLDGLVAAPDFADETVEAVFLQINSRLYVRAAVFFT